uniref:CCHC-type domain-containing protein n=1 Tax=Fagus sylvatica TaxID=28930 RepID=A0A2N9EHJ2_FAGSY
MVRSDQAYEGGDLTLMADLIDEGNLAYEGDLTSEGDLVGEKLKKLKKPIQGMAPEVEAKFNVTNVEEFPKRCAWKIEMEAMRRQLDVLTEQFQNNHKAPPFMGYHRDFDQQWEEQNQNQRYEPRYEQKWEGSVKIDVPEFSGGSHEGEDCEHQAHRESISLVEANSNPKDSIRENQGQDLDQDETETARAISAIQLPANTEDLYKSEELQIKWVQSNPLPPRTAPTFTKSWSQPPKKGDARSNVASTRTVANKATKTLFKNQGGVVFKCFKYGEAGHRAVGCKKGSDARNNDEQEEEQPLVYDTEVEEEEQPLVYDIEVEEEIG